MNLKQAIERIQQLEARIAALEARAPVEHHHHHYPATGLPMNPHPWQPAPPFVPHFPEVWCKGNVGANIHAPISIPHCRVWAGAAPAPTPGLPMQTVTVHS